MKYRILILVDVKQRDLPGYALLKEILEIRYPCEVKLIPALYPRAVILSFQPHLVILMQLLGDAWIQFTHFLKNHRVLVASLPTEGVPILLDDSFLDHMAGRYAEKPSVDLQFCWDEEIYRRGLQHKTFTPETSSVLGVPRFDFYHPSLTSLRLSKAEFCERYRLDTLRPILTWTSNFGAVDLSVEEHEAGAKKWRFHSVKLFQDIPLYIENERTGRQLIADHLLQWAERHPGHNLLVRPHPNERRKFYYDLAAHIRTAGCPSAVPIKEPIWDVLGATDILLQRCCTTGVEGGMMGIPVLELKLNPDDLIANEEREAGMDVAHHFEEMEEKIDYYLKGGKIPPAKLEARRVFLEKWFYKVDGRRTVECAKQIWNLLEGASQRPRFNFWDKVRGWGAVQIRSLQYATRFKKMKRSGDTYIRRNDVRHWSMKIRSSQILKHLDQGPLSTKMKRRPYASNAICL